MSRRLLILACLSTALGTVACAPGASASELLVFRDGRLATTRDPYLPAHAETGLIAPAPSRSSASGRAPARAAARRPSVSAVLARALASGRLTQADHDRYLAIYRRARAVRRRMGGRCGRQLQSALSTLQRIAGDGALYVNRMPAAFLELRRNTQFWRRGPTIHVSARVSFPPSQVVYQHFAGLGIRLHPLANFGRANGLWQACTTGTFTCRPRTLRRLLDEMVAVASRRGASTVWEYYFPFGGGRPPWASGMAQATGLQALARGAAFLANPAYVTSAQGGLPLFEASPPTGVRVRAVGGSHYLLYSYAPRMRVLNAFLQALIGLHDYAQITGDQRAHALFAAGDAAARREVPRYDTGSWSLYSRPGGPSTWDYHLLVRDFLKGLCERTGAEVYCATATRFTRYARARGKPPASKPVPRRCGYL
jgi:hypothetical protein